MSKSLQDQLLGAGLIDAKKAKNISKQKRKDKKRQHSSREKVVSESQEAAKLALQQKQARDRELNLKQKAEADKKAIAAQITQLINTNKVDKRPGDVGYNFTDGSIVKKIYVSHPLIEQISRGRLCIARLHDNYEVIPRPVADKIRERDENAVVVYIETEDQQTSTEDDEYYAQYEIPDDLMW